MLWKQAKECQNSKGTKALEKITTRAKLLLTKIYQKKTLHMNMLVPFSYLWGDNEADVFLTV